jgi:L-tartrate/succinate antiporter
MSTQALASPQVPGGAKLSFQGMWKGLVPIAVVIVLLMLPTPPGLEVHAWRYFAIFTGVIVGLVLEPLPGGAIGLIGITTITVTAPYTLYSAAELAKPGFHPADAALTWALSGFSNSTVWLIFAAFMFALGYEKTGLGERMALILVKTCGRRTLTLGYGIALADAIMAPFTPSNTARSGGTIYPIIRNLPPLYKSLPNDPSARRIGSYIMWVAIATTCVTSSLFLTALAPNLLALAIVGQTLHLTISWMQWFVVIAPAGILLLVAVPLLAYWLYPPQVKESTQAVDWATSELKKLGPFRIHELVVAALVLMALFFWITGASYINATTVALLVVGLMLITGAFTWRDMLKDTAAWNTLLWFGTLVALAGGLGKVGFVTWLAQLIGHELAGTPATIALPVLIVAFYGLHYLFASGTAHVTALMPVMLAVGTGIPGLSMQQYALLLCLSLGLMGILTPFGTGPSPIYFGSGYLPSADYWRLGTIFGLIFLAVFLLITVPWSYVVM